MGSMWGPGAAGLGGERAFVLARQLRVKCGPGGSQVAGHVGPMWSSHSCPLALKSTPHPCCRVWEPQNLRGGGCLALEVWLVQTEGPCECEQHTDVQDPERDLSPQSLFTSLTC